MHSRKKWLVHRRYDRVVRGSSAHRHERAMERPGQACQPVRVLRMNWRAASIQDCRRRWTERRRRSGTYQSAEPLGGYSGCKLLIDCRKRNGPHCCADLFRAVPSHGLGNCLPCIAPRLPAERLPCQRLRPATDWAVPVADYSSAPIRWLGPMRIRIPPRQRAPAMNFPEVAQN